MFIDPRGKPLAHLDRLAGWLAGARPAPVTVEWDLSNVCSLGCEWCHFAHTHEAGPWASSPRTRPVDYSPTGRLADEALVRRGLTEMACAGVRAVVWSGGGEPTLHPRFVDIAQHARSCGLQQGLYTLGGHVTDAMARDLGEALAWAVVSLDAADGATYAAEKRVPAARFLEACYGASRLAGRVATVGVSFLLHANNWHRVDEMRRLGLGLGATYVTFRPTVDTSPADPAVALGDRHWISAAEATLRDLAREPHVELDVDRFLEYRDWTGHGYAACHGITLLTMVTPDGRVWVCPNRRGMPGSELGDLRVDSFAAIWSRHPRCWTEFGDCRAFCRLHLVNRTLADVYAVRPHADFI